MTFFKGGNTRGAARPVVPERLLSLLDKAKAYPLFQKDHPDALAGVLHAAPNATNYYDNFRVITRDVWRFEEEDTLIFHIDLENTSCGARLETLRCDRSGKGCLTSFSPELISALFLFSISPLKNGDRGLLGNVQRSPSCTTQQSGSLNTYGLLVL